MGRKMAREIISYESALNSKSTSLNKDFLKWVNDPNRERLAEEDLRDFEEAIAEMRATPAKLREFDWD